MTELLIPRSVLRKIRAHALSETRPGWEVGGHLRLDGGGVVVEYEPVENLAVVPGIFQPPCWPPDGAIPLHSHFDADSSPSFRDVAAMRIDGTTMAIYSRPLDEVRVWRDGGRRVRLPRDPRALRLRAFDGCAVEVPVRFELKYSRAPAREHPRRPFR